MTVYEEYKVYGPYLRSDGRQHVILIKHDTNNKIIGRKTISYPKYIVEKYLNRYLTPEETVDHIDGNFSSNQLNNLRVVPRKEHCKSHAKKKVTITKKCPVCNTIFSTNNAKRKTCGSKHCAGKCAHLNGHNQDNSIRTEENKYFSNRSLLGEIHAVDTANSGKPLVGNPEQGT